MSTIFKKIIDKEIPADIVYEDELVMAFKDINPLAPVHILIIPKKEIATVNDVTPEDEQSLGRLLIVAAKIAKDFNIDESGYRLIININDDGGQEVYHLHMHILGGRALGSMLPKHN
ncbi:MAG: histidine triad nucleotide-binding protein [Phototrophicaceae bacterium]